MNNKYLESLFLILVSILSIGCSDFGDINVDPNTTTQVDPHTLLTSSERNLRYLTVGTGNFYSQYLSSPFNTTDLYDQISFNFNFFYTDPLINLQEIINLNTDEATKDGSTISGSNNNQIAVARILKSFWFFYLTDRWGPLPYSESLKGRADFKPVYDSQEAIYKGIFNELEEAFLQIDDGLAVQGDILLAGDMEHWKLFANSIRLIASLRISKVDPILGRHEFNRALENGVINSNDRSVFYHFLPESSNENLWYPQGTAINSPPSDVIIDKLKSLNDPRLFSFADPAKSTGEYIGMPYGILNPAVGIDDVSLLNSNYVRRQDGRLPLLTYAHVLFSMAEAAYLGWISEDTEQLYYDGIKASMEQWFAYDEDSFDSYISQTAVAWDDQIALQLIGEQKWIALFMQGYESWAEWRRTGYPELLPAQDAMNESNEIPVRQAYPTSERDLNYENWNYAVDTWLGGSDGLDSKLWWDVD